MSFRRMDNTAAGPSSQPLDSLANSNTVALSKCCSYDLIGLQKLGKSSCVARVSFMAKSASETDLNLHTVAHQLYHLWKFKLKRTAKIHTVILVLLLLGFCSASVLMFTTMILSNGNLIGLYQAGGRGSVSCDFSDYCTSVCDLKGDVRVKGSSLTVALFTGNQSSNVIGKIRPYTRKWERMMKTISEVSLIGLPSSRRAAMLCDVRHSVPAVIFSTGGYTGNAFHDFNDGLVPLYITSERFKGKVVFMVSEFKRWWPHKYSGILKQLTHFPVLELNSTEQVHCFPEVIVGLSKHGDLLVNPSAMTNGKTMSDFQRMLRAALNPERLVLPKEKPRLVIASRERSRMIVNQNETAELATQLGFQVDILAPKFNTRLSEIYRLLNSADVFIGVHGAALTHFLFMSPNSTFVQVIPLGLDEIAELCFGQPATKAGLHYIGYHIMASESTLSDSFASNHSVLVNPEEVIARGWTERKKFYLDGQNIRLSLPRIRQVLKNALHRQD